MKERHGMTGTPEYTSWRMMRERCYREDHPQYPNYGGRGIKVHESWNRSFKEFFDYIGPKPFPKAQCDRIDTNGNYEPGNVRWTSNQDNSRTRRTTRLNKTIVRQIRKMQFEGSAQKEILNRYKKYPRGTILHVIYGDTWKDVVYRPRKSKRVEK